MIIEAIEIIGRGMVMIGSLWVFGIHLRETNYLWIAGIIGYIWVILPGIRVIQKMMRIIEENDTRNKQTSLQQHKRKIESEAEASQRSIK